MSGMTTLEEARGFNELSTILALTDELRIATIGSTMIAATDYRAYNNKNLDSPNYRPPETADLVAIPRYVAMPGHEPETLADATYDFWGDGIVLRVRVSPFDNTVQYGTEFGRQLIADLEEYLANPEKVCVHAVRSREKRLQDKVIRVREKDPSRARLLISRK